MNLKEEYKLKDKIKSILIPVLLYILPILIVVIHYFNYRSFIQNTLLLYFILFGAAFYIHFDYYSNNKDKDLLLRKIYFFYTFSLIIGILPEINKLDIFRENTGIGNLSPTISTIIVIGIISFIIYLVLISNFQIKEISFGNTKISMLKEKYGEEVSNHFDNTNKLLKKIQLEGLLIQNMEEYCHKVLKRMEDAEDPNIFFNEYQILLEKYFTQQNEKIKVFILRQLDNQQLEREFGLKSSEINILRYRLEREEIYPTELNNVYYLFIPFYYIFEECFNDWKPIYIVLESSMPILCEAESTIIRNVLTKFSDDLYKLI